MKTPSELPQDLRLLIDRLVELHGEDGLAPTRADWAAILSCPAGEPLHILNLLKFRSTVKTSRGDQPGASAYSAYSAAVGPAFARAGGQLLYFGKVNHIFSTVAGSNWDAAILTRYPGPRALADFWLDEDFFSAHEHRVDGVAESRVLVMSALAGG